MSEGKFTKRIQTRVEKLGEDQSWSPSYYHGLDDAKEEALEVVAEAKHELEADSYFSWVSPEEPKPAIKYIAIEYKKWQKWFGE